MRKFFVKSLILSLFAFSPLLAQAEKSNEQQILNQLQTMEKAQQKGQQQQQQQVQKQEPQQQQQQAQKQEPQQQQQQVQKQEPQQQQQQAQKQESQQQQQQAQKQESQQQQQAQKQESQQQQQQQAQKQETGQTRGNIGPNWVVGQQWIVETTNTQSQNSEPQKKCAPIQWLFQVVEEVQLKNQPCFRLKIQLLQDGINKPFVDLWVSKESGTIVRITTHTFIQGKWQEYTETYQTQGKSTPVFGTIPSLPLDMPSFSQIGAKDAAPNTYKLMTEHPGEKSTADVGFVYRVQQKSQKVAAEKSATLLSPNAKGLEKNSLKDALEIEINGSSKYVKQVWAPNLPWPVFSSNGTCEARLININPANNVQE